MKIVAAFPSARRQRKTWKERKLFDGVSLSRSACAPLTYVCTAYRAARTYTLRDGAIEREANESKIKQTDPHEYRYECRREKKKSSEPRTEAEEAGDDEIGGGDGSGGSE